MIRPSLRKKQDAQREQAALESHLLTKFDAQNAVGNPTTEVWATGAGGSGHRSSIFSSTDAAVKSAVEQGSSREGPFSFDSRSKSAPECTPQPWRGGRLQLAKGRRPQTQHDPTHQEHAHGRLCLPTSLAVAVLACPTQRSQRAVSHAATTHCFGIRRISHKACRETTLGRRCKSGPSYAAPHASGARATPQRHTKDPSGASNASSSARAAPERRPSRARTASERCLAEEKQIDDKPTQCAEQRAPLRCEVTKSTARWTHRSLTSPPSDRGVV